MFIHPNSMTWMVLPGRLSSRVPLPRPLATPPRQPPGKLAQRPRLVPCALPPRAGASPVPSVRINKCFREFASRRESDRFVEEGRVSVNGARAHMGQRVSPGDVVTLDGRQVAWEMLQAELAPAAAAAPAPARRSAIQTSGAAAADDWADFIGPDTKNAEEARNLAADTLVLPSNAAPDDDGRVPLAFEERFVYIKYFKPRGVTCTTDRNIRGNIIAAVQHPCPRLFTVGRLDKDSTGIILLTSDGRLPNAVLRARGGHAKEYLVTAHRPVPDGDRAALAAGVVITTVAQRDRGVARELTARTLPCRVARAGDEGRRLQITLTEGRNRQIRRMLDVLGYDTMELHRTGFMGIGLEGVAQGEWRALRDDEMRPLRAAVRAAEAVGAG